MASLANDLQRFKGRRVLITGHTGFKGSWLGLLLARAGARVTGIALAPQTNPSHFSLLNLANEIDSRECDIRDLSKLEAEFQRAQPEVVFHLAAQAFVRASYADPYTTFSTNVLGSANVLECVSKTTSVTTLVFVTSDKCYKNKEQQRGYVETDELGGIDPYSQSKAAAEMVFAGYCAATFNRPNAAHVASARAGNVVGGGDWSPDRLIPDCIRALERTTSSKFAIRVQRDHGSTCLNHFRVTSVSQWHSKIETHQPVVRGTSGLRRPPFTKCRKWLDWLLRSGVAPMR